MDFKVGGTEKGITAIQVDIKVDGLSYKIISIILFIVSPPFPITSFIFSTLI